LVILPTETVYGLAALATSSSGVEVLKNPPAPVDHPAGIVRACTWHAPSAAQVIKALRITQPLHRRLFARLAPGPVRFLVQKPHGEVPGILADLGVPQGVIEFEGEFAIRIPDHPLTREVLETSGGVVIADRVSAFGVGDGRTLPEDIDALAKKLGVAAILDDGATRLGKPSTPIRLKLDGSFEVLAGGLFDDRYIKKKVERLVVFVCTGNTCRSPMAAAIAKDFLTRHRSPIPTRVASAGVATAVGEPMTREAQDALREMNIEAPPHRAHDLTRDLAKDAEVIYAMTKAHVQAVLSVAPFAAGRVFTLDPEGSDVPDPIGGSPAEYRSTAQRLKQLVERRMTELLAAGAAQETAS
jgi:protein-tyrosine phosphatase